MQKLLTLHKGTFQRNQTHTNQTQRIILVPQRLFKAQRGNHRLRLEINESLLSSLQTNETSLFFN